MKIIILFVLAGGSFCGGNGSSEGNGGYDDGDGGSRPRPPGQSTALGSSPSAFRCDSPYPNQFANDQNCLQQAMENVPELMGAGITLLCKHKNNQILQDPLASPDRMNRNDKFYEKIRKEMEEFKKRLEELLRCAGCTTSPLLEETGAADGNTMGDEIKPLGDAIHSLNISGVLDLSCVLLCPQLTSKCKAKINENVAGLRGTIKQLHCEETADSLNVPHTLHLLNKVGCVDDAVMSSVGTLGNVPEKHTRLQATALKNVVDNKMNQNFGKLAKPLSQTLCSLTDITEIPGFEDLLAKIIGSLKGGS